MSESTIDHVLRALEDAGVVRRDAKPGDARQRVVTLVEGRERHRA